MFRLNQGSPLLLFQIKSVETRLPCCVVHWSGAAGDIWPTGPMLTLSDLRMSTYDMFGSVGEITVEYKLTTHISEQGILLAFNSSWPSNGLL